MDFDLSISIHDAATWKVSSTDKINSIDFWVNFHLRDSSQSPESMISVLNIPMVKALFFSIMHCMILFLFELNPIKTNGFNYHLSSDSCMRQWPPALPTPEKKAKCVSFGIWKAQGLGGCSFCKVGYEGICIRETEHLETVCIEGNPERALEPRAGFTF